MIKGGHAAQRLKTATRITICSTMITTYLLYCEMDIVCFNILHKRNPDGAHKDAKMIRETDPDVWLPCEESYGGEMAFLHLSTCSTSH